MLVRSSEQGGYLAAVGVAMLNPGRLPLILQVPRIRLFPPG